MAKPYKKEAVATRWDSEVRMLAWLATVVSVCSFLFYFQRGEVLLYGDAVAHINIARRVFDSRTPGLLQLGTVWLPLPHLLMIPFLVSIRMWRTGAGGSIPSMAAYVFGVIGIFRLTRNALSRTAELDGPARVAAWVAAVIYAANPNLIYMQSTAMGESVYLAFFIWAVAYFGEAVRGNLGAWTKCGLCLAAACLTRYDGWFLAIVMAATALAIALWPEGSSRIAGKDAPPGRPRDRQAYQTSRVRRAIVKFILITAVAPVLWLAYNEIVYQNPLEFANGPYSAKAIEMRTQSGGNPGHPGTGSPLTSGLYFLKAAQDNVAENAWLARAWVLGLVTAVGLVLARLRKGVLGPQWSLFFLLIPIPFYALSVAYGGVPIFIPQWWPFTHYNARYGLQLLPAFAVALALMVDLAIRARWERRLRGALILAVLLLVIASYVSVWGAQPITLVEAEVNMRTRNQLEKEVGNWLEHLPPNASLLMYLGDHVGVMQRAGIPLSHTINEGNHRTWRQPTDPEGLWERALADPTKYADYILAFEGDPVWQAVHGLHLRELVEIQVTGQARAVLYRVR